MSDETESNAEGGAYINEGHKIRRNASYNEDACAWVKKDPKKHHWHFGPIAVKPSLQGQGIGSQMMEYYCNHVDWLGMAAYHETDSRAENVKFYQRFGFQMIGEETIMDFPVWYLWRHFRQDTA